MSQKHRAKFNAFTATFPEELITQWKDMIAIWQEDKTCANPFEDETLGKWQIYVYMLLASDVRCRDHAG